MIEPGRKLPTTGHRSRRSDRFGHVYMHRVSHTIHIATVHVADVLTFVAYSKYPNELDCCMDVEYVYSEDVETTHAWLITKLHYMVLYVIIMSLLNMAICGI